MKNVFILIILTLISFCSFAQTNDLTVFSEKGEEFTLYVNSIKQNESPSANVRAKDIRSESFIARVVFTDKNIPEITQNFWTESKNVEISAVIMVNKKGKYVLRYMGEGPKTADTQVAASGTQATYEDPGSSSSSATVTENSVTTTTTTVTTDRVPREQITITEPTDNDNVGMTISTNAGGENVSIGISANENGMDFSTTAGGETVNMDLTAGENGMNFTTTAGGETVSMDINVSETGMNLNTGVGDETVSMDINVSETGMNLNTGAGDESVSMNIDLSGMNNMDISTTGDVTTTYTTTTTTTTTSSSNTVSDNSDYSSNYSSGTVSGCPAAMSEPEFADALASIKSKSFEDSKLTTAKQICKSSCLSAEQIRDINKAFGFEDTRLEFAKYAYDYVYDASKYYKVNDSFQFEMTIEELDEYLQSK